MNFGLGVKIDTDFTMKLQASSILDARKPVERKFKPFTKISTNHKNVLNWLVSWLVRIYVGFLISVTLAFQQTYQLNSMIVWKIHFPGFRRAYSYYLLTYTIYNIILSNKFGLISMGMKQIFFFFWKKNSKWPTQKKLIFQNRQFSKFFHENFSDGSLG